MSGFDFGSARRQMSAIVVVAAFISCGVAQAQVAVRAKTIYTNAGTPIADGVIISRDGKIVAIGPAATTPIPDGFKVLDAKIATPGLIDARGTVGVSGLFNQKQDQDQLERSSPVQPELRAIDAYNPNDKLVEWVRSFGVTTIHTGHAPGELISGQTTIVKTVGKTVDEAVRVETAAVAATLGPWAQKDNKESPGTRAKMIAMLRAELIKAQEYEAKRARKDDAKPDDKPADRSDEKDKKKPDRNLRLEMLVRVLAREIPLMVTANRAQDINGALRLAKEFNFRLILDSASESYQLIDEIKAADGGKGVPVIIHPSMFRAFGEMENHSFETAAKLRHAGITVAMESGFESYVPKSRVVLYEAAIGAANGLTFDEALATITIDAARVLGIDKRVGSLAVGKDADIALYDGDPFEYTTHCIGVVIDGKIVSERVR